MTYEGLTAEKLDLERQILVLRRTLKIVNEQRGKLAEGIPLKLSRWTRFVQWMRRLTK